MVVVLCEDTFCMGGFKGVGFFGVVEVKGEEAVEQVAVVGGGVDVGEEADEGIAGEAPPDGLAVGSNKVWA